MIEMAPSYKMSLIEKLNEALFGKYNSYANVELYIKQWQKVYNDFGDTNFDIFYRGDGHIDLKGTLHSISPPELLIKIAVDIDVETPNFIPAIPIIRNTLKNEYKNSLLTFEKALRKIEEDPDVSVGLANSTLESIIKHILEDSLFDAVKSKKLTLYKLTQEILKSFSMYPNTGIPMEVQKIGTQMLNLAQSVEDLRSNKTTFHGKDSKAYIVDDSLYAYFVVNATSTMGLFLIGFYEKKFKALSAQEDINE